MANSFEIKIGVLSYLRFVRNFYIAATEVRYVDGSFAADVLASDKSKIWEVEIKCSERDFLEDFKKQCWWNKKHDLLENQTKKITPNWFSFCVPLEMEQFALKTIQEKNDKYGLIIYDDWKGKRRPSEYCINIAKTASYLHKEYYTGMETRIIKRMSSELCRSYKDFYKIIKKET